MKILGTFTDIDTGKNVKFEHIIFESAGIIFTIIISENAQDNSDIITVPIDEEMELLERKEIPNPGKQSTFKIISGPKPKNLFDILKNKKFKCDI